MFQVVTISCLVQFYFIIQVRSFSYAFTSGPRKMVQPPIMIITVSIIMQLSRRPARSNYTCIRCVCLCVCNLFSCLHCVIYQSNFHGEALSSLDLGTAAYADMGPSYLTRYLFQGHIRHTRLEPHCSVRLCTTPVFPIYCGDGVQSGCVCRCLCMDLHFLETALI